MYVVIGGTRGWGNYIARKFYKTEEVLSVQRGTSELNGVLTQKCHFLSEPQVLELVQSIVQRDKIVKGLFFTINYRETLDKSALAFSGSLKELCVLSLVHPLVLCKALKEFDKFHHRAFISILVLDGEDVISNMRFDLAVALASALEDMKVIDKSRVRVTIVDKEPTMKTARKINQLLNNLLTE